MFDFGFLPKGITLKKLIWLKASVIIGAAYQTFTGTIARFLSPSSKPVKSIVCNIEPVQDLHGYDNPWPAGGGKNLAPVNSWSGHSGIVSNMTLNIPANTEFTLSLVGTVDSGSAQYALIFIFSDNTDSGWISLNPSAARVSATRMYTKDVVGLKYYSNNAGWAASQDVTLTVTDFQIELGSSATSYAPYSNLCPISGFTGLNVYGTGANLLDPDELDNSVNNFIWGYRGTGFLFKGGKTYTLSFGKDISSIRIVSVDEQIVLAQAPTLRYVTYTPTVDTLGVIRLWSSGITMDGLEPMLSLSSMAQPYQPYVGTTLPVSWQSEAGTVYAGYLSVDKAGNVTLTGTHGIVDLGTLTWNEAATDGSKKRMTSTGVQSLAKYPASSGAVANILCSEYKAVSANDVYLENTGISINAAGTISAFDTNLQTAEAFKTAMSGVQLVYELATPVTYTLSSVTVPSTVQGENNWWHDANGNITIEAIGTPISSDEPDALQSLNILLGGAYTPRANFSEPTDEQALNIIMGGSR